MRPALLFALVLGCHRPAPNLLDLSLPEASEVSDSLDPTALLREVAANDDPTPRAQALALLIAHDLEPPARGLYDPSPWVQRAAAHVIAARLDQPAARSAALGLVGREQADPWVRGWMALRLDLAPDWQIDAPSWQRMPLALAAAAQGDADAEALVAAEISRGDLPLELDFVADLGGYGPPTLLPALQQGSERVEEAVSLSLAGARIILGDPAGEGTLRKALTGSDSERQLEALDVLCGLAVPDALPLLRKAAGGPPGLVRWYARLALVARTDSDRNTLLSALSQIDPEVRQLAMRFAAELGPGHRSSRVVRRVLAAGLTDPHPEVRAAAARALDQVGLAGEAPLLRPLLSDDDLGVRIAAAGALLP